MTLWSEFALLGLVAGLVAAIGAETALAVLQTKVFDFPWEPDWRLWLTLPLAARCCFRSAAAGSARGC
jgi:putative ABC transport system permease protein